MRMIGERRGGGLRRLCGVLLFTLVVLAVAGWFGVRTRGARELIEHRLSRRTGLDVTVATARIVWPYDLMLDGVRAALPGADAAVPGLSADSVRLGCRPAGRLVVLEGVDAAIRNDEEGRWEPAFLAGMGELLGAPIGDISRVTAAFRHRHLLRISDGTARWLDARDQELTVVEGVSFQMAPIRTPRFPMTFYELSVERVRGAAAAELLDMRWTWLAFDQADYIELESPGRRVPPGGVGR